jgi:hypothetical protein
LRNTSSQVGTVVVGSGAAKIDFPVKSFLAARKYQIHVIVHLTRGNSCKFDFTRPTVHVKSNIGDDVHTDVCIDMYI